MKTKILLGILAALSIVAFCALVAFGQETVPQTQAILKSYFQTGQRPTQTNYAEFIDTMFWYAQQSYSNSLVAANAAAGQSAVYKAWVNFSINGSLGETVYGELNISSITLTANGTRTLVTSGAGNQNMNVYTCNVVMMNAIPGTNYLFTLTSPNSVSVMDAGGYTTESVVDGALNTPLVPLVLSTTNFVFNIYTRSQANLNGLNIVLQAH